MLTEASSSALSKFLELGNAIIVAAEVACDGRLGIGPNRPTSIDAVIATYLFFVSLQHLLRIQDLVRIL